MWQIHHVGLEPDLSIDSRIKFARSAVTALIRVTLM
jgi:hypothetical protein